MNKCTKCKEIQEEDQFYKDKQKKNGLSSWCRDCMRIGSTESWQRLRAKDRIGYNKYRQTLRQKNLKRELELAKIRRVKLKNEIFAFYSENKNCCACCGEKQIEFLAVDHINNNGAEERKNNRMIGHQFYAYLKRMKFPKGYQILCNNCNIAKFRYGICPHKIKK